MIGHPFFSILPVVFYFSLCRLRIYGARMIRLFFWRDDHSSFSSRVKLLHVRWLNHNTALALLLDQELEFSRCSHNIQKKQQQHEQEHQTSRASSNMINNDYNNQTNYQFQSFYSFFYRPHHNVLFDANQFILTLLYQT